MVKGGPALAVLLLACLAGVSTLSCDRRGTAESQGKAPRGDFAFGQRPNSGITFLSTQLNPVEEAYKMRSSILKDFPGSVDFRPNDNAYLAELLTAEEKKAGASSILVGALHGDLESLYEKGALRPLDELSRRLRGRGFAENLVQLSRFDGAHSYYIPWMQASFVMAANRKALPYLPKGASLNALTYQQLEEWASNIRRGTGRKALGFPAGEKGLMHRFFQGYLYPSFTGSTLLRFRSRDAAAMWDYFKGLWDYAQPSSLVYSTMSEPLLIDEVWIAWDHTARLVKAFQERPNDFVAFPAPSGPKGRGYLAVVSGLSLPRTEPETGDAALLVDYLTQPKVQERLLSQTGFSPVVELRDYSTTPPHLRALAAAVESYGRSKDAILTLMPIGLGEEAQNYNGHFMHAFSEIVLEGKDIRAVLDRHAAALQGIVDKENLKCWLPDKSDARPCRIE